MKLPVLPGKRVCRDPATPRPPAVVSLLTTKTDRRSAGFSETSGSPAPGEFSVQLGVPARDVRLTVEGAGPISFPVTAPQAKRMIASARSARFGRGEQTLMDLSVRDTWEITPDQVTLTGLDWDSILTALRDELGLPARARLRAEPHALLVYGKGQFFLPHQDSEKDSMMIGTLVVSLPSSRSGGELVIEHNDKTVAYQPSTTEVSVAAFYADCRHQVKPVRTGYRVTFTCTGTSRRAAQPQPTAARCRSSVKPGRPGPRPVGLLLHG